MTHKLNRLTALVLAVVMAFSMLLVPASAASYNDVSENAWYKAAVDYVQEKGWMAGVSDTSFAPNKELTRGMMVTVLARVAGAETNNDAAAFADTAEGKWFTGAAAWAAENGIVSGVGDGKFAPNRAITRQDLCVMLYKYISLMGYELKNDVDRTFSDMESVSDYARDAVIYCTGTGLVSGFEDSSFRPRATATRAQVAQLMMRLDLLVNGETAPTEPMPAQSFEGEAGEDMAVSVNAPEGALPENTKMTVSRVTDEAALAAIQAKVSGELYAAADITFTKDGADLEPEKAVEVQISLDGLENLKNPTVYHVNADGSVDYVAAEVVSATRGSEKVLRFYASEFSVYAIGDNGSTVKTLTVNFYDQAGEIVSGQVIRLDQLDEYIEKGMEFVHDPGVPAITDTQSFEGWADKQAYTEEDTGYSVADINEKIKTEKAALAAATADQTWNYYAKVYEVVFVTFHDQDGVVIRLESIHLDSTTLEGDYTVNLSYTPFKGGWAHVGWTPTINNTGDTPTYPDSPVVYENGDTITLTSSLDLYPYLKEGYWLMFDNYIEQDNDTTSASFTTPRYYGKDEPAALPTDYGDANNDGVDHDAEPYRVGYTFGGWYTDKSFTTAYTARQLTADTTVYAKWTPRTDTPYMVVIWTQRADDPVDANDLNNNYDFYEAIETRKGTTGATANFLTSDTTLGGTTGSELGYYFTYNQAASDTAGKTIKGDGTTVLNVYYNRRTITINFWTNSDMTTRWSGQAYVEAENGAYYYYNGSPSGYYFIGTGPNASYQPSNGDTVYYPGYMSSAAMPSVIYYSASYSMTSHTMSSSYSYVGITDDDNYWFYKYSSSRYYPLFYKYTASYEPGYYRVGQGPTPTATGTHNLTDLPNPMVGLYQAPLTNWPSDPATGYEWAYDDAEDNNHYGITLRDCYDIPDDTHTTEWNIYAEATAYTAYKTLHWMCEDLYGSFVEKTTTQLGYSSSKSQTQYYDDGKFLGFKAYGHNLSANSTETSGGFVAYTAGAGISTDDAGQNAFIYFTRRAYNLSYMSQGSEVKTESGIKYQQPLSGFDSYEPTNGPVGYYFDGWYKDPGFEEEFDWTGDMPNNNVAVYAKWTKMRFRVTLDYTGGDSSAQVTFPANQASTFRVYYGEKVGDTAIIAATREGYTLLGWYLDPQGNHPFNFAEAITDQTYNMDRTYVYGTGRTGTDAVTGNPYNDDELNDDGTPKYANVVGKVTIYAVWRQNPIGSDGIRVRYDAIEGDGYFPVDGQKTDPRVIIRDDPNVYTDTAKAFVQVASTPEDDENYRFLYWVVMQPVKDAQGNVVMENGEPKLEPTTIKVYPGQTFTVDYDYTVQVEAVKVKWIFKDADGGENLTDTTTVNKGAVPTHSKPSGYVSGSSYYPVVGWTDGTTTYYYDGENHTGTNIELPAVSENTTLTAVYGDPEEVSQHQFTVTWKNWDGTVLKTEQLTAGTMPSYTGAAPTRPADDDYTYTFSGWTPAITVVSGDVTYTATYTAAEKTYTVTFHANGGTFGSTSTQTVSNVTKGTLFRDIFPTTNPTHSTYYFFGWFTAATGGTEIEGAEEFDGTMTNVYAHWYKRTAEKDTSGTFIEGDCYSFRSTYSSTNYYMNSATTGAKLTGITGTSIPATAQWIPEASSAGGYTLENFGNRNTWLHDYTSDTDYLACSDSSGYRMHLETASSTNGTFYLYSGEYYVYFNGTNYEWRTSSSYSTYRTAFTVMHVYNKDMNASTTNSTGDASISAAVAAPAAAMTAQKAFIPEQKLIAPAATRGNTGSEIWEETTTIVPNEEYLIGVVNNGNVYLVVNYSPLGNNYYVQDGPNYDSTYYDYNTYLEGYTALAVIDSQGRVTGINDTTASGLSNCVWKFSSATGGTVTSAADSTRYLYGNLNVGTYNSSDNYIRSCFPFTTATTWTWDATNSYLYAKVTTSGYTAYNVIPDYYSESGTNVVYGHLYNNTLPTDGSVVHKLYRKVTPTNPQYLITWSYKDANGVDQTLTQPVEEGTTPTAPSVPETYTLNGVTYRFTGWDKTIAAATEATTYTAQYEVQSYTITWNYKDSDGNDTSATTEVAPGATPEPGFTPASYTSGGDEYRFTGWSPAIVAATGPATYTAQYSSTTYTITWHTRVDGGNWTTTTTTVDEGQVPSYNSHPIWTDGNGDDWMFSAWNSAEDGTGTAPVAATADADYWAQYTKVGVYTYTMYLHAVYGLYNKSGTHVTWFGNNDPTEATAGVQIERDKGMQINIGYPIPKPDAFVNGVKDYAPDSNSTQANPATTNLTYEDHVFLGWARLEADPNDTANAGSAHPDLTEDDLYLKWDAASGKYYLNTNAGNAGAPVWSTDLYTNIAADEMTPYHDMYAVWTGYAYVYHSATGKIEAVEVKRGTTVDLVDKVPSDCLYGGYYTEYGGVKNVTAENNMRAAKDNAVQNAYAVDHSGGSAERLVAVNGAVNYTGAMSFSDSGTNVRFWTRAKAFGYGKQAEAPSGDKLVPEVGQVYYLKEVPETYLTTKFLYTYDKDKENEIQDFFMLTLVDDSYYSRVGFRTVENAETVEAAATGEIVDRQSLASYFTLTQKNHDPVTVNAASFGLSSGYVGIKQYNDYIAAGKSFSLMPAWETYDGVEVNSHGAIKLSVDENMTSISYSPLGSVTTPFTSMYVKLNDNVKSEWLYYDENDHTKLVKTRLYFFNDAAGTNAWVDMSSVDGTDNSVWTAPIPEGNWEAFIVVRCNPDNTLSGWDAKWNQTGNITFNSRTFNLVTITGSSSGYGSNYNYTTGVYGQSNP